MPLVRPARDQAHIEGFEEVTALITQGDYEKALGRLLEIRRGADNPSVAGPLDAKIAELRKTIAHNQFVGKFNAAAEHFNHQRWDEAIAILAEMLPLAPERRAAEEKAGDLLAQARKYRGEYARIAVHNRFVAVLNEATALYNAKKPKEAADLVERQLAVLVDPEDVKLAKSFIDQCRRPTSAAAAERNGRPARHGTSFC